MKLIKLNELIAIIAYSHILVVVLLMAWTFLTAYLSFDYSTIVYINNYNEAHVELYMLIFTVPISLFWVSKKLFKEVFYGQQ